MCAPPQKSLPNDLLAGDTPNTWNPYVCLGLISSMQAAACLLYISLLHVIFASVCLVCMTCLPLQLFPLCLCMSSLPVHVFFASHLCLCLSSLFASASHVCLCMYFVHVISTCACHVSCVMCHVSCVSACRVWMTCLMHASPVFSAYKTSRESFPRLSVSLLICRAYSCLYACVHVCVRACVRVCAQLGSADTRGAS